MSDEPSVPAQTDADHCLNCGAVLHGEYCHACGQRHLPRIRVRALLRTFTNAFLNVTDLGSGLWGTLYAGARNPGRLARRYVEGERQRFVNPISYILIAITLLFVVYTLLEGTIVQTMTEAYRVQFSAMGVDTDEAFGPGSTYRRLVGWTSIRDMAQGIFGFIRQTQTYITLLLCLVAAGLLRLLCPGYTYAELVVFELYAAGQAMLYHVLSLPIFLFTSVTYWFALGPVILLGLLSLAGSGFFGGGAKGWGLPPLAYIGAYVVFTLAMVLVGFLVGFLGATTLAG
ncbi:MAG: DUF3667 domain-containing protein [Salinibacter sp.]